MKIIYDILTLWFLIVLVGNAVDLFRIYVIEPILENKRAMRYFNGCSSIAEELAADVRIAIKEGSIKIDSFSGIKRFVHIIYVDPKQMTPAEYDKICEILDREEMLNEDSKK